MTPKVAVRLGKLFGDGPGPWVRMPAAHDTWHAAREVDTSQILTLDAARRLAPRSGLEDFKFRQGQKG